MPLMAKKKPASDGHSKTTKSYRFSDDILKLLDTLSKKQRRTKTTIIEMALEEFGRKHEEWPLKPDDKPNP